MIKKLWFKLPVVVRAIAVGLSIQIAGVASFAVVANLNLQFLPSLPWSLPVELAILWALFQVLRGHWWPASSGQQLRRRLRAEPVPRHLLATVAVTGAGLGCAIFCQMIFTYRMIEMPAAAGGGLLAFLSASPLTAFGILLSGVIMTGFVEEAAFRGYMQQPMEERYGPAPAITIVAVLFAVVHMPPLAMMPLFAVGSLGWGIYARLSASTVPGMVVHALVDAVAFTWIFIDHDFLPSLLAASTWDNGMDTPSWLAVTGLVIGYVVTITGFVRIAKLRTAGAAPSTATAARTTGPISSG